MTTYVEQGGADGEKGETALDTTSGAAPNNPGSATTYYKNDATPSTSNAVPPAAGTTPAGKSGSPSSKAAPSLPGTRLRNPLSNFSSYTYQLTLYMITPEAYNSYVASGRSNIDAFATAPTLSANNAGSQSDNNGVVIIAQNGGITNSNKRAAGFDLDYYIDDLKVKNLLSGKGTMSSTADFNISFNIIEPYGFSFLTNLRKAMNQLQQTSKILSDKNIENPTKQLFILGLRFTGYDKDGNALTGKKNGAANNNNPSGNSDSVFERFYDIIIHTVNFKIDGKTTVYSVQAESAGISLGAGTKYGMLDNGATATATTVREALEGSGKDGKGTFGILTKLNQEELARVADKKREKPNVYKVLFLGDESIANATIINKKSDSSKSQQPMGAVENTMQVTDATSVGSSPNNNKKTLTFTKSTPILQAIDQIIKQSSYLEDGLSAVVKDDPEEIETAAGGTRTLRWYSVGVDVAYREFDKLAKDYSYEITYIIQPFDTPVTLSTLGAKTRKYYGPCKRYEYAFTGQNSEVLSFEQTINNGFFTIALIPSTELNTSIPPDVATVTGKNTEGDRTGAQYNKSREAQNNYVTSIYDPASWAKASITIHGDPDFIMRPTPHNLESMYNQFYEKDGFTINPSGGQTFIEVDFNEGVDYSNESGLMKINRSIDLNKNIRLYDYPPNLAEQIKGVCFQIVTVESSLQRGKFVQTLQLQLASFGSDSAATASSDGRENSNAASTSTGSPANGGTPTGLTPALAPKIQPTPQQLEKFVKESPGSQVTSPTGGKLPGAQLTPQQLERLVNPVENATAAGGRVADGDADGDGNSSGSYKTNRLFW